MVISGNPVCSANAKILAFNARKSRGFTARISLAPVQEAEYSSMSSSPSCLATSSVLTFNSKHVVFAEQPG
jgi:hypothetical protein